jgi:hypothetical protein
MYMVGGQRAPTFSGWVLRTFGTVSIVNSEYSISTRMMQCQRILYAVWSFDCLLHLLNFIFQPIPFVGGIDEAVEIEQ